MTNRTFCSALVVWLSLAGVALAADCVCEDAVTPGTYIDYKPSENSCPALSTSTQICHKVDKGADTTSQRAINIGNPHATPPIPPSVPEKYRKVVNKLVVEMTAAEKAPVDAAENAAKAEKQSWQNELNTNDLCNHLLVAGLEQYYDAVKADIDAEVEATTGDTRAMGRELNVKLVREIRKIAKVVCGVVKVK